MLAVGTMTNIVGIDIGATNLRIFVADKKGNITKKISEETKPEDILGQISRHMKGIPDLEGIGIAVAGRLDLKNGMIINSPNAQKLNGLEIRSLLGEQYKTQCLLLNDCTAGVLGEKTFGAGKETENLVYLSISTGVGCGAIIDNKLILGKDGNAHEAGHMILEMNSKMQCGCGGYGHWESFSGGRNIPKFAKYLLESEYKDKPSRLRDLKGQFTAKDIFDLAGTDAISKSIVDELAKINTIGVANIVSMYDPEILTIGGAVALYNSEHVISPIIKNTEKYAFNRPPKISESTLKGDAILYGAIGSIIQKDSEMLEDII